MNIKNLENNARKYVSSLGNFHVLEYQSISQTPPLRRKMREMSTL